MLLSPIKNPIKPVLRSPIKGLAAAVSRYFHRLKPAASQHYRIGSFDFGNEYEIEISWVTTDETNQVLFGDSHVDTYYLNISNSIAWWSGGAAYVFDTGGANIQDGRLQILSIISTDSSIRMKLNDVELVRVNTTAWSPHQGVVENILVGSSNSNPSTFDGYIPYLKIWTGGNRDTGSLTDIQFDTDLLSPAIPISGSDTDAVAVNMTTDDAGWFTKAGTDWVGVDTVVNGSFEDITGWAIGGDFMYSPGDAALTLNNAQGDGNDRLLYRRQKRPDHYRVVFDADISSGGFELFDGVSYSLTADANNLSVDVENMNSGYWNVAFRALRGTAAVVRSIAMRELIKEAI